MATIMHALAHSWPNNYISSNTGKVIWNLIPAAIAWTLWTERNCRTFQDKYSFKTDGDLCEIAKVLILSWAAAAGNKLHTNFSQTILNWASVFY